MCDGADEVRPALPAGREWDGKQLIPQGIYEGSREKTGGKRGEMVMAIFSGEALYDSYRADGKGIASSPLSFLKKIQ